MSLLDRLETPEPPPPPVLTPEQDAAVEHWRYIQRVVTDATGPTKGHMSLELVKMWHEAGQGVFAVGLDPTDYLRVKK